MADRDDEDQDFESARIEAVGAGVEVLCTHDDCEGEERGGRAAYGWHVMPAERARRVRRALAAVIAAR